MSEFGRGDTRPMPTAPDAGIQAQAISGASEGAAPLRSAEEISAVIAGMLGDPRAFKHRIAADASISGRIHFPGNARVDGRLKGEIRADAVLVVGEKALLEADVRADRLLLQGTVHGGVTCPGFAEFAPGSVVVGDVVAATLLVRQGARIDGRCRVGLPVETTPASAPPGSALRPAMSSAAPPAPGRRLG